VKTTEAAASVASNVATAMCSGTPLLNHRVFTIARARKPCHFTAESPYSLQWAAPFPLKIALPIGDLEPNLMRGSVAPPESSTQTAYRSVH